MIHLKSQTDLIAAIPALIGFTPVNSLVTFLLNLPGQPNILGPVVRQDLFVYPEQRKRELVDLVLQNKAGRVALVSVADEDMERGLVAMKQVRAALEAEGVDVQSVIHIRALTEGAAWVDVNTQESGILPSPKDSEIAAETVLSGRVIGESREELVKGYEKGPVADMKAAFESRSALGDDFTRATIVELADVVRTCGIPSALLAARVGVVAAGPAKGRDALLGVGIHGTAYARSVMAMIANQLRSAARVQTLTLAAVFAYATGEGAHVGMAIEAAHREAVTVGEQNQSFLNLVDQAFTSAMPPENFRALIDQGIECAGDLGVEFDA